MSEVQEKAFTVDDVEKKVFDEASLAEGVSYYDKVMSLSNELEIYTNFEADDFPEGHELAFSPIKKRQEGNEGNKLVSIAAVAIPTLETVLALEATGEKYIRSSLRDDFIAKATNTVRPRNDGSIAGSMPKTVNDFITSSGKGEGTKTFTAVAPAFVKFLKKSGLRLMTSAMLKQVLQSSAFAKSTFGKVEQDMWEKVLVAMIQIAEKQGLDPSILNHWRDHRDEAKEQEMNFDFSGLDAAFGENNEEGPSGNEGVENTQAQPQAEAAHG